MRPVTPRVGQVFAEWMVDQDHSKAHAAVTPFRFSGVMGCARALGYSAAGLAETDPMDGSSLAITGMGSLLHEDIQEAVKLRWPTAQFETKGAIGDLISGHVDIDDPDYDESIEIKTVGAYKFDQSIGLRRSPGRGKPAYIKEEGGDGPSMGHICQAGFNARAHGRSIVRIVYLSREAVSVKKARQAGLSSIDRFWAEWTFSEDQWGPLVDAEIVRLEGIRASVKAGVIPERQDFDDNGNQFEPDPETHWRCDGYCQFAYQCEMDGPGVIAVPVQIKAAS